MDTKVCYNISKSCEDSCKRPRYVGGFLFGYEKIARGEGGDFFDIGRLSFYNLKLQSPIEVSSSEEVSFLYVQFNILDMNLINNLPNSSVKIY